jgi:hypothetical protein
VAVLASVVVLASVTVWLCWRAWPCGNDPHCGRQLINTVLVCRAGGRNDVATVEMDYKHPDDPTNSWNYLTTCRAAFGENPEMPTSIILPDKRCNSLKLNGSLGHQRVIQAEAALNSWPLSSSTRLAGLQMKQLFADAMADPAPWVFLPSWNEFVVGPIPMRNWDYPMKNQCVVSSHV